jgi:phosphoribosylaminoimidazole (AIR) synthetase
MDPVIPVTAHAHVTGGGIVEKFGADILLPSGLSAVLDNLWDPPLIMSLCREWSGMNLRETYETWNGGQGWLTVTESCNVADFQAMGSEEGIEVKDCGEIIETPGGKSPTLSILSKYPGSDKSEVLEWSFD